MKYEIRASLTMKKYELVLIIIITVSLTDYIQFPRHCAKHIMGVIAFNPHNNPVR